MKSTLLAAYVGSVVAIDGQAACLSACGLVASADSCKRAVVEDNHCKMMQTDGETLLYGDKSRQGWRRLRVDEAIKLVVAPRSNCFAMCYENRQCRSTGSYCTAAGICPNLYWNKTPGKTSLMTYQFFMSEHEDFNTDSAVLCDFVFSEQPVETEHIPGFVDPCPALCALSHTEEECKLVQRSNKLCRRLYWTNDAESETRFSVQSPEHSDVQVTVQEAFELLLAPDSNCKKLCDENAKCVESHCNTDNRTCKDLYYNAGVPVKDQLVVCFGSECQNELVPVMCQLNGDTMEAVNGPIEDAINKVMTSSTTKDSAIFNGVIVIGMIALLSAV